MGGENFRKLMEIKISLQDAKNLRKNLTCVMREEGDHYLEELVFIVDRGFKEKVKGRSNK